MIDGNDLRREIEDSFNRDDTPTGVSPSVASISINIEPRAIPNKVVQHTELHNIIFETFRSTIDPAQVRAMGGSEGATPQQIIRHQIQSDNMVIFEGGYLEPSEGSREIISIQRLGFGSQNIMAEVSGTTEQAFIVCKLLLETLWIAIGRRRNWSELEHNVNLRRYSTSTVVDLGFSPRKLFSNAFEDFLNDNIANGEKFGARMGGLGQSLTVDEADLIVTPSISELTIEVSIFDKTSGKQEEHPINIIPHTQFDHNRGLVKFYSALPYDAHVDMISRLIARVRGT